MVFGNADPYAVMAALAASKGPYTFPQDIDPSVSRDTLMVYYLDWKKAEITASIPSQTFLKNQKTVASTICLLSTLLIMIAVRNWFGYPNYRTSWKSCAPTFKTPTYFLNPWTLRGKTPLIIHLKHTETKSRIAQHRTRANKKRKQGRKDYMASKASSSGSAFQSHSSCIPVRVS